MQNDIDPASLRAFVRVAELSSFTRAAEALSQPKGRVSQRVAQLEALLGARLLQRSTRSVRLTPDGEAFLPRAQAWLAEADELGALFRQRKSQDLRGHLRVDLPARLAVDVLIPALPAFLAAHPGLSIDVSATDRRVNPLEEGFDCVLRVGRVGDESLVARRLGELPQLNLAAPAYLKRQGRPRHPRELAEGHTLVHYGQRFSEHDAAFEWLDAQGQLQRQPMASRVMVNHTEAYEAAALAGLGLIQAPPRAAGVALVEVLKGYRAPSLPVHLVWPQQRHLSPRTRVLIEWLDGLFRPRLQPPWSSSAAPR